MSSQTEAPAQSTLSTYLNDHLAGSKAGIQMVEKMRADNAGSPLGEFMDRLATDIESDRDTLEGLMIRLGLEPSALKQAAGWTLERLSRVRVAKTVTGSAATSRLMQLEALSLGIEGKRLLWKTLQRVTEPGSGVAGSASVGVDFDTLIARAESQREQIEPFRLEAAGVGLS